MESINLLNNGSNDIATGFYDLDYAINGLNKSELIVIASRLAMGKTNFLLNIATNVAVERKIPVALFNLELSKEQCIERMIAQKSSVNINNIKTNIVNDEKANQVKTAIKELADAPIYIDDTPVISFKELREKSFKLKEEKDIGLILVDYLQLINDGKDENICALLKNLAQELDIPVVVLSQLSKAPQERFENGLDPKPILSDINKTISKESDVLIFLHRDNYYSTDSEEKDIVDLIIAKNKLGNTGTVKLLFKNDCLKFKNIEGNIEE